MGEVSQYAGVWRDQFQHLVATVYGGTQCQAPRDPRSLAARTEDGGYEAILRCRKCEGCRRYEKLLLQRRLAAHYQEYRGDLWQITISGSEPWPNPLRLPSSLMRRLPSCVGMIRRGLHGLVLIATARPKLSRAWLGTRRLRAVVKKIALGRGARAFADCALGLMVPRIERADGTDRYENHTNRFYFRGLPELPTEKFIVERKGGIRKRHPEAKHGLRAWREGFTLYASQRTTVYEWLKAMRSWRSTRLETPSPISAGRQRPAPGPESGYRHPSPATSHAPLSAPPQSPERRRAGGGAAPPFLRPEGLHPDGRDASSRSGLPQWAADFVARMTAIAKTRPP